MATYELIVPKLGESVIEATITKWLKHEGDIIHEEDPVVEIATDKVDSEIPSPVSGKLVKKLFAEGDVIPVGGVFAILETESKSEPAPGKQVEPARPAPSPQPASTPTTKEPSTKPEQESLPEQDSPSGTRFYSPLVRSIAQLENIPFRELDAISGSGKGDRVTKQDLLEYIRTRNTQGAAETTSPKPMPAAPLTSTGSASPLPAVSQQVIPGDDYIVEMDRIRQLIAAHMVRSVQTSAHVTSFMEIDMSRVVLWRDKNKDAFQKREKEKLTFTPIFIEAIAKAVRDFPMVNVSVDGAKIVVHKNINIGMAVALPNFNLIVPVIRNADQKNLLGLAKHVNDLAERSRLNKLVPDEISGGTLSLTNLGSFGTLMGTPIINQPQTAIVAVGAIKKRPVVIETPEGDVIGIRPMMIMSVTYDHRVIDGSLGGQFLARIAQYLEQFDPTQTI